MKNSSEVEKLLETILGAFNRYVCEQRKHSLGRWATILMKVKLSKYSVGLGLFPVQYGLLTFVHYLKDKIGALFKNTSVSKRHTPFTTIIKRSFSRKTLQ